MNLRGIPAVTVALLTLLAGCGPPRQEELKKEQSRLRSLSQDYRARAYYGQRDGQLAAVLLRLAGRAEAAGPTEEPSERPEYPLALFLYAQLRPSLPNENLPEVPDQRDVARALRAAAAHPPPLFHALLGTRFLFDANGQPAFYELSKADVASLRPLQGWLVTLCRAYLYSEGGFRLHAQACLAEAEKLQRGLPKDCSFGATMLRSIMAARKKDWASAGQAQQELRQQAPDCSLERLLSLTLQLKMSEQNGPKDQRGRAAFDPELFEKSLLQIKDARLAEHLRPHAASAYTAEVLSAVAEDRTLWAEALRSGLLEYAQGRPALEPVREWIEYSDQFVAFYAGGRPPSVAEGEREP